MNYMKGTLKGPNKPELAILTLLEHDSENRKQKENVGPMAIGQENLIHNDSLEATISLG